MQLAQTVRASAVLKSKMLTFLPNYYLFANYFIANQNGEAMLVPSCLSHQGASKHIYVDLERSRSKCDLRSRSTGDLGGPRSMSFDESERDKHTGILLASVFFWWW